MKEQQIKFTITVQDVEFQEYWKYPEFTNSTQPTISRGNENAINCIRWYIIKNNLGAFQGSTKSNNGVSLPTISAIAPGTFPATKPASVSFDVTLYRLETLLDKWAPSMTLGNSTATPKVYTDAEIKQATGVLKDIVETALKSSYSHTTRYLESINAISYPIDSTNNMTNGTKTVDVVKSITVPAIDVPVVTVQAAN